MPKDVIIVSALAGLVISLSSVYLFLIFSRVRRSTKVLEASEQLLKVLEQHWLVKIEEIATKNKTLLADLDVRSPSAFLSLFPNANDLWRQAVDCCVFGSYDASVTMGVRCLEIGIRKYNNALSDTRLVDEIDKLAPQLDKNKDSAHSLRMMRNYIHTENLLKRADALEALRRTAIILEDLFPPPPKAT